MATAFFPLNFVCSPKSQSESKTWNKDLILATNRNGNSRK